MTLLSTLLRPFSRCVCADLLDDAHEEIGRLVLRHRERDVELQHAWSEVVRLAHRVAVLQSQNLDLREQVERAQDVSCTLLLAAEDGIWHGEDDE